MSQLPFFIEWDVPPGEHPGRTPCEHPSGANGIAFVGDTGSPELVHLHLEARRVRDGIDASKLLPGRIVAPDATIVCDPRNVLPLK